jgi:UDP-N-acetylmuramoyl-L-alanyl-D-glutamate--2,6-diaminopimelate ligase
MRRADGVEFRAAVFTRITTEHLELHGSRHRYLAAKARLLEHVSARPDGIAVLDAGDPFGFPHLAVIPVATRLTYTDLPHIAADLRAEDIVTEPSGVRFTARTPWGDAGVRLRLAGSFNVRNALAALAAACATGADLGSAVTGLEAAEAVTGRMERIDLGQPFNVVVDYAHTSDALETVLRELRQTTAGRLWAVFGSAGERDVEKRPAMGSVAARLADVSVITDEDPRGEDRQLILEQIAAGAVAAGARRGEDVFVIPDREEAIAFAVANAAPGDTVLCAGKGHEKTVETATGEIPWNERAVAIAAIRRRIS